MMNENGKIEMMSIDMTYKCTLRCLHCFNYSGEHKLGLQELSDEEILNLCDDIIEIKPNTLCICGGEPLLRKDLVYKVIEKVDKGTNGITKISMVTNGELLDLDTAKKLSESGVFAVQVSLDGCNSETHDWIRNKAGIFDKAIKALEYLNKYNVTTMVSCVPTKRNIDQLEEAIYLCDSLGVMQFRVQPLMVLGRAKEHLKNELLSTVEYKRIPRLFERLNNEKDDLTIDLEWGSPLNHLNKEYRERAYKGLSVNINAYGFITISPYVPLYVGNIRENSVIDYCNNGLVKSFNIPFVDELCDLYTTIEDMDISKKNKLIPENFSEKSLDFDLIKYNRNDYMNWSLDECINKLRGGESVYV